MAESLISIIDARNSASMNVAERCGMTAAKPALWGGNPVIIFRIKKTTWERMMKL